MKLPPRGILKLRITMINSTLIYRGSEFDPYRNIALEEYFLDTVSSGVCILYLWQNRDTVVVGRNQNCFKECRVRELEAAGGHLARRLSGGGAVFHDTGNLNFTFLLRKEDYDLSHQLDVILGAVSSLGIPAEKSGRNDLTTDGRKFSGNAFFFSEGKAYHHGTILVRADTAKASRYLGAPSGKLASRGVESIRSRIVNLSEFRSDLTVDEVVSSLRLSFDHTYGRWARQIADADIDWGDVEKRKNHFASPEWKYNRELPFQYTFGRRFPWGEIEFHFTVSEGCIEDLDINSDAMNETLVLDVASLMRGMELSSRVLSERLVAAFTAYPEQDRTAINDIVSLIGEQNF